MVTLKITGSHNLGSIYNKANDCDNVSKFEEEFDRFSERISSNLVVGDERIRNETFVGWLRSNLDSKFYVSEDSQSTSPLFTDVTIFAV